MPAAIKQVLGALAREEWEKPLSLSGVVLPGGLCGEGAGGSRALVVLVRGSGTPGGRSPTLQLPSEVLLPRARGITAGSPDLSAALEEAAPPTPPPSQRRVQSRVLQGNGHSLARSTGPGRFCCFWESLGVQGTPARLHVESPPAQSRAELPGT